MSNASDEADEHRDHHLWPQSGWPQDARFALRGLRRRPLFAATASLLLGLGIAVCAVVFSFLYAVILRPLPLPDAGRLVRVEGTVTAPRRGQSPHRNLTFPDVEALRDADGIESSAAMMPLARTVPLTGIDRAEMIRGTRVSPDFFATVGVFPTLGRPFEAPDALAGSENVVIISNGCWRRRFGGDPQVVGRTLMLHFKPYRVVGIMPAGFAFPDDSEVWMPLQHNRFTDGFAVNVAIARLEPGASQEQVESAVAALLSGRLGESRTQGADGARVTPLHARMVEVVRPALMMLGGAALVVLLVVAINLGGALSARATARRREMAIRRSLGAGEDRIRRLLALESLLISLVGGALGLLFTGLVLATVVRLSPPDLPFRDAVGINGWVVVCAMALALGSGLVSSFLPRRALRRAGGLMPGAYRADRFSSRHWRAARAGVSLQVALATMLLLGAGLLLHSFWNALHVDSGANVENVLTADVTLPPDRYDCEKTDFFEEASSRLGRYSGVQATTVALFAPMDGAIPYNLRWDRSRRTPGRFRRSYCPWVTITSERCRSRSWKAGHSPSRMTRRLRALPS